MLVQSVNWALLKVILLVVVILLDVEQEVVVVFEQVAEETGRESERGSLSGGLWIRIQRTRDVLEHSKADSVCKVGPVRM